jgi:hypothetical protein
MPTTIIYCANISREQLYYHGDDFSIVIFIVIIVLIPIVFVFIFIVRFTGYEA